MPSEPQQSHPVDMNLGPPRIPKLSYRNRIPESEIAAANGNRDSQRPAQSAGKDEASTAVNPIRNTNGPGTFFPTSESRQASTIPRRSSISAALVQDETPPPMGDVKKKKHSSLFGFLSLKEPSTSALEDFARQQQKQAAAKGGRATAVGMPGISSQKLPPTVPKVNSKWDGLPSPVRDKAKSSRNPRRDSTLTVASSSSRSSSSSGMSSQASLSSGASVRFASKLSTSVVQDSISEGPELPSADLANATNEQAADVHHRGVSPSPYAPRKAVGFSVPRTPLDEVQQAQGGASSDGRKQRSDSVADSIALSTTTIDPVLYKFEAINDQTTLDSDGRAAGSSDTSSNDLSTRQDFNKTKELESEWKLPRGGHPSAQPSQHTSTIGNIPSNPPRPRTAVDAHGSKRPPGEQVRPGAAKGEVLPWEVQDMPLRPSTSATIPPKDEEKKRKLGFLRIR